MKEKIKSMIPYIVVGGLGLLMLIFFCFPYANIYGYGLKVKFSGYDFLKLWEAGFSGVMISLFQLFSLLAAIAMIVVGVIGILMATDVIKAQDKAKKVISTTNTWLFFGFALLTLIVFIFTIVLVASNGLGFSAGSVINMILAVGGFITMFIFDKKGAFGEKTISTVADVVKKKEKTEEPKAEEKAEEPKAEVKAEEKKETVKKPTTKKK